MNEIISPVEQVDQAFYYIVGVSFALLIAITVVMIFFVFRYHHKRHPKPSDIRGNWKLEVLWTAIPTLIAVSMFVVGWNAYTGLRGAPADSLEINVYAQQFSWIFLYPNDKETENELVVPVSQPVRLNITSFDVLHSFFLPAFRVKVDAVKDVTTHAWFMPNKIGEFDILCTEYCGTGHADMVAVLKVVSSSDYQNWLNE